MVEDTTLGIAFAHEGAAPEMVAKWADASLYHAKRSGRNRIATAEEGLALAAEFSLQEPTPVDPPTTTSAG